MPKEQEVRMVVKRLRKEGWSEHFGKGDHLVFSLGDKIVVVPTGQKELRIGTYRSIAKVAGWL